jgi:hypothetical protein
MKCLYKTKGIVRSDDWMIFAYIIKRFFYFFFLQYLKKSSNRLIILNNKKFNNLHAGRYLTIGRYND